MSALTNKKWKDYIGKSPVVDVRKISIEIPNSLLTSLVLSTTNNLTSAVANVKNRCNSLS
jgi:hypothetical protein